MSLWGKENEAERLWGACMPEPNSGCWLWLQSVNHRGYGQLDFRGKKTKAHRASWTVHKGEIPDGMMVLHKCDNRSCINPDHLFTGTAQDNSNDMVLKGRAPNRKLSPLLIKEVRIRKRAGETYKSMAEEYGVAPQTLGQAVNGVNWRLYNEQ